MSSTMEQSVSFCVEKVWHEGFVISKSINSEKDSVLIFTHIHSTMDNMAVIQTFADNKTTNLRIRTGKVKQDGKTVNLYSIDLDRIYQWFDGLYGTLSLKDPASGETFIIDSIAHNEGEKNRWIAELNH